MRAQAIDSDRRTATRHPVDYPALAAHPGKPDTALRIVNLSASGFLASGDFDLDIGERVTVRLPVIGGIEAQLAWGDARRSGFVFERVIRLGDFTRMFMEMQPRHAAQD